MLAPEPANANYKPDTSNLLNNEDMSKLTVRRYKLVPNVSQTWIEQVRQKEKTTYVRA